MIPDKLFNFLALDDLFVKLSLLKNFSKKKKTFLRKIKILKHSKSIKIFKFYRKSYDINNPCRNEIGMVT